MPSRDELQVRYSNLTLEKLRQSLVLKDGVVFNNRYEGQPAAGSVKVPVRDTEVSARDYDMANGIPPEFPTTTYKDLYLNRDVAINETIDGFYAAAVPDNLVAERLDSGGYSIALTMDEDGANALLAGGTAADAATVDASTIYSVFVAARTALSKANIPNDGNRYALVTPDWMAYLITDEHFTHASNLGDEVIQEGVIGKIAGFKVIEWNTKVPNLGAIFGHPAFATRCKEWKVPVHIADLDGSSKYIGASAVKGRMVYGHLVTRPEAVRAVYTPDVLEITASATGASAGTTKLTIAGVPTGLQSPVYKYRVNPSKRIAFDTVLGSNDATALASNVTASSTKLTAGDVLEVMVTGADNKVKAVGYVQLKEADIKK